MRRLAELVAVAALCSSFPTRASGTDSVSCASAGNCSAGGHYTTAQGSQQAFVAAETGSP